MILDPAKPDTEDRVDGLADGTFVACVQPDYELRTHTKGICICTVQVLPDTRDTRKTGDTRDTEPEGLNETHE